MINKHQPFFSVIIPTYNRATHLVNAVNSILNQKFSDFEIIVVDDGSTDETKAVIGTLEIANKNIKYYFKKNEERSIARNYGIKHASGKYINFLDSDDIAYQSHLATAYKLLEKNNFPEVGHLGYEHVSSSGESILIRNNFDECYHEKLIHENILHGNAIFIRRDIISEINFIPSPNAIVSEDWYVWLRLAARYQFYFDNMVTSSIIHHDERSLMNIDPDKLIINTKIIVEYLKRDPLFKKAYKRKVSYHFANHYTFLTLVLALTKSRRLQTIRYLMVAMRYDPKVIFRKRFLASIKYWF